MYAATRISFARSTVCQQDMIHAAGTKHWVVHAHGNAGTQQSVKNNGHLAGRDFTDMKAYPFAAWWADPPRSRRFFHRCLRQIASDAQVMKSATVSR
jgi:hypothetical protein